MGDVTRPTSFGMLLRQHRLNAGLTQAALAERAGISARAVQDLERSIGQPQRETARRLANALTLLEAQRTEFEHAAVPAPRSRATGRQAQPQRDRPPDARDDRADGVNSASVVAGEYRRVTVLVAEISGLTDSDAGFQPDVADRLLGEIVPVLIEVVEQHGGTVSHVGGDGIVALFGMPTAREDDAVHACRAALALQDKLDRRGGQEVHPCSTGIGLRVGLDSGTAIVRTTGDDAHPTYTVMGPAVRGATRLGQSAMIGATLLTRATLRSAKGDIRIRTIDVGSTVGLTAAAEVFELVEAQPPGNRFQRAIDTRWLSPITGRANELSLLDHAASLARGDYGQVVALVGEPGVGKSRLVWEMTRSRLTDDWLLLTSGAITHGSTTPYLPVIELLRGLFGVAVGEDEPSIRTTLTEKMLNFDIALRPDIPALLSLLDVSVEESSWQSLDPPRRRRRTLDALKRLLLRVSQERPLVLVLEDLHWIDSETQAFLDELVESVPAARILVLVTYRPEYEHPWGRRTYYTQIRVGILPPAAASMLLGALVGDDDSLQPLKQLLIARTEGNPLFLEECVQDLVESRVLVGEPGAYRQAVPVASLGVPSTIQSILTARIDRLPPEEKRLLQTAAAIGVTVPLGLLQSIAGMADADLHRCLYSLRDAELLHEAGFLPEPVYAFKHALTHEVTYGGLLHEHRRALHRRVVDAIERLYADRLEEHVGLLAYHALRGEDWEKAVAYGRQAGLKAIARSANREAVGYFEQAFSALRRFPEHRESLQLAIDLRLDVRPALITAGQFHRVLELLLEAQDIAERLDDQHRLGRTLSFLQFSYFLLDEHERAIETGERALTIGRAIDDVPIQVVAAHLVAFPLRRRGDYRRAIEVSAWVAEAVQGDLIHQRFGVGGYPAYAARGVATGCLAELGEFSEGMKYGSEAIRIAKALDHPYGLGAVQLLQSYLLFRQGRLVEAMSLLEECLDLFKRWDLPQLIPEVEVLLGTAYVMNNQCARGISLLEQAHPKLDVQRVGTLIPHVSVVSEGYVLAGRLDEARQLTEDALDGARHRKELGVQADCLRLLGEIAYRRTPADFELGEAHYRAALELAQKLGMRPLVAHCRLGLGKLYRRVGRPDEARADLTAAIAMFREMGMAFWLPEAEVEFLVVSVLDCS